MPRYQAMVERANDYFNGKNLANAATQKSLFAGPGTIGAIAQNLVAPTFDAQVADATDASFLDAGAGDAAKAMPTTIHEALKALIYTNLNSKNPYAIQFLWMPGPAWEMTVCELKETLTTTGGISVLLKSPIP